MTRSSGGRQGWGTFRLVFLLVTLVSPFWKTPVQAAVPCTKHAECEAALRPGSECQSDGTCSNPYHKGGCLHNYFAKEDSHSSSHNHGHETASWVPTQHNLRVCHSEDPPDAALRGYCRPPPLPYPELRLARQNWESHTISAWLLQIILGEVLGVPVTIETGSPDVSFDFYRASTDLEWNVGVHGYEGLQVANDVKDCRLVHTDNATTSTTESSSYTPCFHVDPEVWSAAYESYGRNGIPNSVVRSLGLQSTEGWYIPQFVLDADPSLATHVGLQGEDNRRKLADTFKRPTTWKEYCQDVSNTNCEEPDTVAQRPPTSEEEETKYFAAGLYTGHFRATLENDCGATNTSSSSSCTGHFADWPCGWASFFPQQSHHLNIALSSSGPEANGGYPYDSILEIWEASNATREPVMILGFDPGVFVPRFRGTDVALARIGLTPATFQCQAHRTTARAHDCAANVTDEERVGSPLGSCDTFPQTILKLWGTGLEEISSGTPVQMASPAHAFIENWKLTNEYLDEIFDAWLSRGVDRDFDPREAVCEWVAEHLDVIDSFLPPTFPRVVEEQGRDDQPAFTVATVLSVLTAVFILTLSIISYTKRKTKVMYYTQMEFVLVFLGGLFLVSIGTFVLSLPPTNETCTISIWFIEIGYAVHLLPVSYRIAKINSLVATGKQMQRVWLIPKKLLVYTVMAIVCAITFMLAWTVLDAPHERTQYILTSEKDVDGYTIVEASHYCGADSQNWYYATFLWKALLIIPGFIIALMARMVQEDLNDTKLMARVLINHTVYLVVEIAVFAGIMADSPHANVLATQSILISLNLVFACSLYMLPKLRETGEKLTTDDTEILPDTYVDTTVALMDLTGFSEWASVREPVHVFKLLEAVFGTFDEVARRKKVFKVETVGECYVCATGVPHKQNGHAVLMAEFVHIAMKKMKNMVKRLETKFGPDTSEISLRVGMHSGPVTGGFLLGKGARFQLFGDTMTLARVMLSQSKKTHIHVSETTAALLIKSGKGKWLQEREDRINTPERGEMTTHYLVRGLGKAGRRNSNDDDSAEPSCDSGDGLEDDKLRWIEFNVGVFEKLLKQLVNSGISNGAVEHVDSIKLSETASMPLEEVKEIIEMVDFDKRTIRKPFEKENIELSDKVLEELREYVAAIASLYNDNPFHGFAHASYVVMAVTKYMNRIIAASEATVKDADSRFRSSVQMALHDYTYGFTGDPLLQFACVYSALIHDVDHPGVPNPQLIEEDVEVARRYKSRSVAEQKSLDLSWNLLMEDRFAALRSTICRGSKSELRRFRQLVINSVMATDLGDKELKALRNGRWDKAFQKEKQSDPEAPLEPEQQLENPRQDRFRKATIVIEHLIQAADVAHMSQHWNIYRKWNELLYREMYKAYRQGRSSTNPADGWYKGEIGFFDFYIIPLSKKLSDCGVFGPTSGENLNNAQNNRNQWVREGEAIVKDMVERVKSEYDGADGIAGEEIGIEAQDAAAAATKELLAVVVQEDNVWEGSSQLPKLK